MNKSFEEYKEKIDNYIICHKKGFTLVGVIFTVISSVIYIFDHTPENGFNYTIAENASFTMYNVIFALYIHFLSRLENMPNKMMVNLYILFVSFSVVECVLTFLLMLGMELTPLTGAMCMAPFLAALIMMLFNRRDVFKQAGTKVADYIRIWFKVFFGSKK